MGDVYISGNSNRSNKTSESGNNPQSQRIQPQQVPSQNANPYVQNPYANQQKQRSVPQISNIPNNQRPTQPVYNGQGQYQNRAGANMSHSVPDNNYVNNRNSLGQGGRPSQRTTVKKKKGKVAKILISLLLGIVIIFSSAFALVYNMAKKIDYNKNGHADNIYVNSSDLVSDKRVTNILLIGVDGKSSDKSLRSDTMLMVSIDRNNKKLKLTSFLRDTWVMIPSTKRHGKLNASYAYGGPQLVMDTIEYNYNVEIDHYMLVGFDMFKTIIDSFGGIDVEVTEKEADFMRRTAKPTRHIQAGPNVHMNGSQALVYCRIRKLDSDFMRTFRQRKVISALIAKAKKSSLTDLKNVADSVLSMIQTDISPLELTKLAFGLPKYITYEIESERIPTKGTFNYKTINGQSVIATDINQNRQFIHNYLYSEDIEEEISKKN